MSNMIEKPEFERVAVLGAGTMGAGIAQICSLAGSGVALLDIDQKAADAGLARIRGSVCRSVEKGRMSREQADRVLAGITPTSEMVSAVGDADLVIEAIPEDLELKKSAFAGIAARCREDAVLATNTSSLSLARIFEGIPTPSRCIGTHFFNPPPIMPLLEIVRSAVSAPATVDRVRRYALRLGKEPIVVKDSPGFATSRLGVVLGLEAIRMVEAGVAEAAAIDKAMELGYRHPMGPLRLTDLVGLDVRMAIADYLHQELDSAAFEVPKLMREMVARGETGKKAGRGFYDWSE